MFIEQLRQRRSIRKYSGDPLAPTQVAGLEEALLRAPSSRSLNPWEFVFVDDPEVLARLARAKPHGSSFLAGAALGVVVCGDPAVCDVWVEDCSIATIFLHLAAQDLGLGSCWIQIRERPHDERQSAEEYVRKVCEIPERLRVLAIVAVGRPAEERAGHPEEQLPQGKIHRNKIES